MFNARMPQEALDRIKEICFRRSVHQGAKISEAELIMEVTAATPLPPRPTEEQIKEYKKKYPKSVKEYEARKRRLKTDD